MESSASGTGDIMTETKLLIDTDGIVQNRIVVDEEYTAPSGMSLKADPETPIGPGDAYDGTDWHQRPSVPDGAPDGSDVEWTGDKFVIRQPDGTLYSETQ